MQAKKQVSPNHIMARIKFFFKNSLGQGCSSVSRVPVQNSGSLWSHPQYYVKQTWKYIPLIPALGKQREGYPCQSSEPKASLSYNETLCLRVSIASIGYHDQFQVGEKKIYLAYTYIFPSLRKLEAGADVEVMRGAAYWLALYSLLSLLS